MIKELLDAATELVIYPEQVDQHQWDAYRDLKDAVTRLAMTSVVSGVNIDDEETKRQFNEESG